VALRPLRFLPLNWHEGGDVFAVWRDIIIRPIAAAAPPSRNITLPCFSLKIYGEY
jgi:hypothetical protein